jgi:hypothetical protein
MKAIFTIHHYGDVWVRFLTDKLFGDAFFCCKNRFVWPPNCLGMLFLAAGMNVFSSWIKVQLKAGIIYC